MAPVLSDRLLPYFHEAGWSGPLVSSSHSNHPAISILANFNEIHLGFPQQDGNCDIEFESLSSIEHLEGKQCRPSTEWAKLLDSKLVCFAEYDHSHGALLIGSCGRIFNRSLMHDAMSFLSTDFSTAIEGILFREDYGFPMLRPDQDSITWCGKTITKDSQNIYKY